MKTLMIALLFLFTTQTFAKGGKEGGNGGHEYGLQFQTLVEVAMKNLETKNPAVYVKIYRDVEASLAKVKVLIVDEELEVTFNNVIQKSVAVNFPEENLIHINSTRWNAISVQQIQEAIALHEILSLTKLEQTGVYTYSAKYLAMFDISLSNFSNLLPTQENHKQVELDEINDLIDLGNESIARGDYDEALKNLEMAFNKSNKTCKQSKSAYACNANKAIGKTIRDIKSNYFYQVGEKLNHLNERCPNAFARMIRPMECSGLFK